MSIILFILPIFAFGCSASQQKEVKYIVIVPVKAREGKGKVILQEHLW
jgi:hypothetical protein